MMYLAVILLRNVCVQIEAGAEVIITQLFYDVERFVKFVKDCRGLGIHVPIIPGKFHRKFDPPYEEDHQFCYTQYNSCLAATKRSQCPANTRMNTI